MLTGVVKAERYSERAADVYLALLSSLFPKFTATTMRRRKYDPAPRSRASTTHERA